MLEFDSLCLIVIFFGLGSQRKFVSYFGALFFVLGKIAAKSGVPIDITVDVLEISSVPNIYIELVLLIVIVCFMIRDFIITRKRNKN